MATSPHNHLNADELIGRIITELRPFVAEALRNEIKAQKPKVTEEDIVAIVIKQLQDTVIRVIKAAVASSTDTDLLKNQEKLGKILKYEMILCEQYCIKISCYCWDNSLFLIAFLQCKLLLHN